MAHRKMKYQLAEAPIASRARHEPYPLQERDEKGLHHPTKKIHGQIVDDVRRD